MTELERLQKEINGKVIVWDNGAGARLDAICIYPPNGAQVSIKPYGYTPEEICKAITWRTPEEVANPKYCLTAIQYLKEMAEELTIPHLRALANVNDGGTYNPYKAGGGNGHPSCPYG